MTSKTRTVTVTSYSNGRAVEPSDFSIVDHDLPALERGEAKLRTLALSVDPALRVQLTGLNDFVPSLPLKSSVYSFGVAEILESKIEGLQAGDVVTGLLAWAETSVWQPFANHPLGKELLEKVHPLGETLEKIDPLIQPASQVLGALGVNGITAYFGILEVGRPKTGETVLVSGAAGGIGSLAGQIAKLQGARVIGLASSEEKRRVLVDKLGFDAALDYRSPTLKADLLELLPNGPDVYFDNVGGTVSNTVMWLMRRGSRVVECGQISTYDDVGGGWTVDVRPIHANGLRFESYTTFHFQKFFPAAIAQLAYWLRAGQIIALETRLEGLDSAPSAVSRMFRGENIGKMIITLS
ncbi:NADP-dependent oxidoreductase [Hydrocarboniphaga sp.]|uniref:MDR family NADP-dependent oxidoreductase n=1 Tax=Hydrocarboniphaga sp. TaxID=2033016 RepID=UPI002635E255|nr:NADP-dependent oxidoreductase [Hydrocarboniphaga sp.]